MPPAALRLHAPLLPLAVCLMAGIATCQLLNYWADGLFLLLPLLGGVCLLRHKPGWQTAGIWCCTVLLGMTLGKMRLGSLDAPWPEKPMRQEVVVVSEPIVRDRYVSLDALTAQHHHLIRCRIAKDEASERIAIGNGLTILSRIKPIHEWRNGHFSYRRYMLCHGFSGETFVGQGQWQGQAVSLEGLSLVERARLQALCLRHQLLQHYRQWGLDSEAYGIVAAMTLGDKSALDTSLKDIYARVGAAHVLALSGMHLMLIYAVVSLLIGWWRWRMLSQVLTVLAIWAFAFLVGLSPSVVRSAFMISVYALLLLGHRERMSVNTLAFTAIVMLAINPLALYDVGFQLSFMAVLAIVLASPLFAQVVPPHVLQGHRWLRAFWGLTTVSLAAQLGTAPLVAYYFGQLPTYFLLSNYLIIPLTTLTLYLSLACIATFWWAALHHALVSGLIAVVGFMNQALRLIAGLPKNSVEDIRLSTLQVYLVYIVIGCLWVVLMVYRKNVQHFPKV